MRINSPNECPFHKVFIAKTDGCAGWRFDACTHPIYENRNPKDDVLHPCKQSNYHGEFPNHCPLSDESDKYEFEDEVV